MFSWHHPASDCNACTDRSHTTGAARGIPHLPPDVHLPQGATDVNSPVKLDASPVRSSTQMPRRRVWIDRLSRQRGRSRISKS